MIDENKVVELENLFASYQYIMTTKELLKEKLYHVDIQRMLNEGLIERLKRGFYHWEKDGIYSDILIINRLFPDAIICLHSALFYYDYSDRVPNEWNLALDRNVSKDRTKIDYPFIKPFRMDSSILHLGETKGDVDGFEVKIYDKDRTICDTLRYMNHLDREIFNKAIIAYIEDSEKNLFKLKKYAKILHVEKKVNRFIGVWL